MNVLVLDIIFCNLFVPDFDVPDLHYFFALNNISNESTLLYDTSKTLGNDLSFPNEIYSKKDNE